MVKSLLGSMRDPTPRASDTPTAQATQVTPLKFDFGEPESGKYYPAFISYKKTRVFQAVSAKKRFKMPISEALLHIKFRIGNKDSLFQLDVAVDTCAAMNLAYKGYHGKIAQQNPQLVAEYIDFRKEGYSMFNVGRIDNDEQGIMVDAAITYLTLSFHNGEQKQTTIRVEGQPRDQYNYRFPIHRTNEVGKDAAQGVRPLRSLQRPIPSRHEGPE
jgi:hypothetical protein